MDINSFLESQSKVQYSLLNLIVKHCVAQEPDLLKEYTFVYQHDNRQHTFYLKGRVLHKIGGPAIIYSDGNEKYYLDGIEYSKEDYSNIMKFGSFI